MSEPTPESGAGIHPPSFQRGEIGDAKLSAALRTLELTVRRKLDGVLQGNHLGLIPGPGSEPGESRMYQPGDDVRRMDWSVTARTTHPHVRQMIADRELETWMVVDVSASLDFGTTGCEKRDLAVAAAAAITYLNSGGGNRIGALIANGESVIRIPARGGRQHEQTLLRAIATAPRAPLGVRGDLAAAIDALRRPERRRGMAVIISDFLGPINWMRPLRAIAARHEVTHVIHNAGLVWPKLVEEAQPADITGLAQLHLGAALSLVQAALPAMKARRFGRILFNGSRAALGVPTRTAYSASKAGMIGMARTWALELAPHGITVNVVAPGPIQTDNFWGIVPKGSEREAELAKRIPVGRLGTVEDVSNAFLFFCDPGAGFVTGQTLYVCGGASVGSMSL